MLSKVFQGKITQPMDIILLSRCVRTDSSCRKSPSGCCRTIGLTWIMGRTRCSPTSQNEDDITTFNLIRDSEIEFRMRGGRGVTNKKRRGRCPTKFATAILVGRQPSPPPPLTNSTLIQRRAITICKNCDSQALMAPIYLIRVERSPFLGGKS